MKILHKTIKKQWFDMIASGVKKHEYLDIKPYWVSRFIDTSNYPKECPDDGKNIAEDICYDILENECFDFEGLVKSYHSDLKSFDIVHAFNGGSACLKYPNIQWKHEGITIGEGNPEWGAEPGKKYFILKIGSLLNKEA